MRKDLKFLKSRVSIKDERAFTFLEVMLAIFIFVGGTLAVMGAFSGLMKASAESEDFEIATWLAKDMMDEIISQPFDDPDGGAFGTEEAEPRSNFDDVDDYDGWSKSPPKDIAGTDYDGTGGQPSYSRFTRAVTVENVPEDDFNVSTPSTDGTTDAKRIIVTVSWGPSSSSSVALRSVVSEYHKN